VSDDLLVQRAIKRDEAAFAALYDRHFDRVYRHIYYQVPNPADAEDIAQEVFIRAWKAIGKYRRIGAPFAAWLIAIARNLVIDHFRARRDSIPFEDVEAFVQSKDDTPETLAELNSDRSCVRSSILRLREDKQKVIFMRFIYDLSYREIARVLCKSEGTIRVIMHRALKDLRHILSESGLNLYQ
jgi:RNA polymerase sigma-70 factor (ECF subfamily)